MTMLKKKWTEFSFILKPCAAGIGVFATHDIAAGTKLLTGKFRGRNMKIKDVPADFIKYCVFINEEDCLCPQRFDRMDIAWFLNHSHQPNIAKVAQNRVEALRDIKTGEEILIDYNELHEPEHMKEPYYKIPKMV